MLAEGSTYLFILTAERWQKLSINCHVKASRVAEIDTD
jgi:hypothetical protein